MLVHADTDTTRGLWSLGHANRNQFIARRTLRFIAALCEPVLKGAHGNAAVSAERLLRLRALAVLAADCLPPCAPLFRVHRDTSSRLPLWTRPIPAQQGWENYRLQLNGSHQAIIVASELDNQTERIVEYLSDFEIPVNVAYFRLSSLNGHRLISNAWLRDPYEIEDIVSSYPAPHRAREPWNGESYVSFGDDQARDWDDALKYGFISGGGKRWFNRTLLKLEVGDRVWVNIPGRGYVGVGNVIDTAKPARDVALDSDGNTIFELKETDAHYHEHLRDDDENAEYLVRVEWFHSVPREQAVKETGFFGNQNTVCKPGTPKWSYTVNRLRQIWGIE